MLVLLSTVVLATAASSPCDKARERTDRQTGSTIVEFSGSDWKVVHDGEKTEYTLSVFVHGAVHNDLAEGWNLDMKLTDGNAVRLALDTPVEARSKTDATGSWTLWETAFEVPSDAVDVLAGAPLELVRMDVGRGPELSEVSRARGKKMHQAFACIATLD